MKATKTRITMFVDKDILKHFKSEAAKTGEKYQSLMNKALRDSVFDQKDIKSRLEAIEAALKKDKKRG
jgi:uncharacterized protein (DUF4415 family)